MSLKKESRSFNVLQGIAEVLPGGKGKIGGAIGAIESRMAGVHVAVVGAVGQIFRNSGKIYRREVKGGCLRKGLCYGVRILYGCTSVQGSRPGRHFSGGGGTVYRGKRQIFQKNPGRERHSPKKSHSLL